MRTGYRSSKELKIMWISYLADARDYGQAERCVVQSSIHLPATRHVNAHDIRGGPGSHECSR